MKPIIGVMPLVDEERDSLWMLPGYMNGIYAAGGLPVMFPLEISAEDVAQLYAMCDGFLFTGGQDVNPACYGEEALSVCGKCQAQRDALEKVVFEKAYKEDKPILGICRGHQYINVLMGGTLYQDLSLQRYAQADKIHVMHAPYDRISHTVSVKKDSPLYKLVGQETLGVNSYHHQGIHKLAPGLSVMAEAEDGLVEAVFDKEKRFVWGVQWHPEFSYQTDEVSRKILTEFVKASEL